MVWPVQMCVTREAREGSDWRQPQNSRPPAKPPRSESSLEDGSLDRHGTCVTMQVVLGL